MKDFVTAMLMLIAGVLLAMGFHFKIRSDIKKCESKGGLYFRGRCL